MGAFRHAAYCRACGVSSLSHYSRFCHSCGASLAVEAPTPGRRKLRLVEPPSEQQKRYPLPKRPVRIVLAVPRLADVRRACGSLVLAGLLIWVAILDVATIVAHPDVVSFRHLAPDNAFGCLVLSTAVVLAAICAVWPAAPGKGSR